MPDRLTVAPRAGRPVPTLVEMGIVPSAEILARVIPQITAQVRAAGITNPSLRRLYAAIYTAFRRRRSLLLLNLESQVKLGELPWVRAIEPFRQGGLSGQEQARQTLEQVVTVAVTAFPEQILPNKLLQEVRALADAAGLKLPIVDELAADIFMGDFSEKFVRAAQVAARLLTGTLYERYYGVPFDRVRQIDDVKASRYGTATSPTSACLCVELAGQGPRWPVGCPERTIIEQQQILTTHNLAVLFGRRADRGVAAWLRELAEVASSGLRRLQQKTDPWQARLRMVKNGLRLAADGLLPSLLSADRLAEFLAWSEGHLGEHRDEFRERFGPAPVGLQTAGAGVPSVKEAGAAEGNGSLAATGKHWLLR